MGAFGRRHQGNGLAGDMSDEPTKSKRGFALFPREKLMAAASKGGKNCPPGARGFSDRALARRAGRAGGLGKKMPAVPGKES